MASTVSEQISIDFFNWSESPDATVLIWQDTGLGPPLAWKVIAHCHHGWRHPFAIRSIPAFSFEDAFGNHTPEQMPAPGYIYSLDTSRRVRRETKPANSRQVVFRNGLREGGVRVNLWQSHLRLARSRLLTPGETLAWTPDLRFKIGVDPAAREGMAPTNGFRGHRWAEIDLRGLHIAWLVMVGGGWGYRAGPFAFHIMRQPPIP